MSEEKKKTKNQIVLGKVRFILNREWSQSRPGNQAIDLVWKDPKTGTIFNLETAYETEKLRDKKANAGDYGSSIQGAVTPGPLTTAQKKELEEKKKADVSLSFKTKSKK